MADLSRLSPSISMLRARDLSSMIQRRRKSTRLPMNQTMMAMEETLSTKPTARLINKLWKIPEMLAGYLQTIFSIDRNLPTKDI